MFLLEHSSVLILKAYSASMLSAYLSEVSKTKQSYNW